MQFPESALPTFTYDAVRGTRLVKPDYLLRNQTHVLDLDLYTYEDGSLSVHAGLDNGREYRAVYPDAQAALDVLAYLFPCTPFHQSSYDGRNYIYTTLV